MNHASRDTMEYTGLGVSWKLYIIRFRLTGLTSKKLYGAYQNVICSTCIDILGVHLFHVFVYYMLDLACVQSIN